MVFFLAAEYETKMERRVKEKKTPFKLQLLILVSNFKLTCKMHTIESQYNQYCIVFSFNVSRWDSMPARQCVPSVPPASRLLFEFCSGNNLRLSSYQWRTNICYCSIIASFVRHLNLTFRHYAHYPSLWLFLS